jgi:hypothetical protein
MTRSPRASNPSRLTPIEFEGLAVKCSGDSATAVLHTMTQPERPCRRKAFAPDRVVVGTAVRSRDNLAFGRSPRETPLP